MADPVSQKATTPDDNSKWVVAAQSKTVSASGNGQIVGGTITLQTAGKYLDRDIEIAPSTVNVPGTSVSKTSLGYGESVTVSAGYLNSSQTIKNSIGAGTVKAGSGTIAASVSSTAGSDGKYPITGTAVTVGVTASTAGYVSSSVGTKTSGSVGVSGSVAASTLSASSITPGSQQTVTIGAGYYPSARTVTVKAASEGAKATLLNALPTGKTEDDYTDNSDNAPVLVSGGYLYINGGYIPTQKISLAKLVPDNASGASSIKAGMLSTVSAYDNDGNLVTGNITTRTSNNVSVSGKTVTTAAGYYASAVSKSVATAVPTIGGTAMTSGSGTADTTSGNVTITVPVGYNETARTITASSRAAALSASGTINTATIGSVSVSALDTTNARVTLTGSVAVSGSASAATSTTGRAVAGTTKASATLSGTAKLSAYMSAYVGDYTIA